MKLFALHSPRASERHSLSCKIPYTNLKGATNNKEDHLTSTILSADLLRNGPGSPYLDCRDATMA